MWIRRTYEQDPEVIVWWSTEVECMSALARLDREGSLPADAMVNALARLHGLAAAWLEVQPIVSIRRTALRLLRVHALRAADALQLAAAIAAAENNPPSLSLVTLDDRLADAAQREGFSVTSEPVGQVLSTDPLIREPTAPDEHSIALLRQQLSWPPAAAGTDQPYVGGRLVAEREGNIMALAEYGQNPYAYHPQRYWIRVGVHPRHRRRGMASALYAALESLLRGFDGRTLTAEAVEEDSATLRFLFDRAFRETNRRWSSVLDLAQLDRSTIHVSDAALERRGITIRSWPELAEDPDREAKLYALDARSNEGSPNPEPVTMPPASQHIDGIFGGANALPDACFVAVSGDQMVGRSNLVQVADQPGTLEADYTGVDPDWRGRGIATALKRRGISWAIEHGRSRIITDSDSLNAAMLHLNQQLGFVRGSATIHLRKVLAGAS